MLFLIFFGLLVAQNYPFQNTSLDIDSRVENLLSLLTANEKIAQMQNAASAISRLGIPAYDWWNEALHGVARSGAATSFPQTIGMAATFDDEALFKTFTIISDEARAKYHAAIKSDNHERYYGLTFWTPNINIFRDSRWGRGQETYGEDPYLTGRMGKAVVRGLQGDDSKYIKAHACAKHYAVHSGPESSRHTYDALPTPRDLWTTYLPAFKSLVTEADVKEVMCVYNRVNGKPGCASDLLLGDILRSRWKFSHVVVSDCDAIEDFYRTHHTHPTAEAASIDAVLNGTDLDCGTTYSALRNVVGDGITEDQLDVSVRRLLYSRFELGMFDPDSEVPYASIPSSVVESDEHVEWAAEIARKSIVLLRNNNSTLPLSPSISSIAVVGPNANDTSMQLGNYNGEPTKLTSILQGIQKKAPRANITYIKGCDLVNGSTDYTQLVRSIVGVDVVIFVGGIGPSLEGEEMYTNVEGFSGGDKTDIELPAVQRELLAALRNLEQPLIEVICTGSAIALNWDSENADALLVAWYPGQAGGTAVADVLFGDYNPAGRLPVTFLKNVSQLPEFEDYVMNGEKGRTYRYLKDEPLYPFGYGLSYTRFTYGRARLNSSSVSAGEGVDLTFDVNNQGEKDGDEVVQVYVRYPSFPLEPIKALKEFRRINIKARESLTVTFTLPPETFETFNDSTEQLEIVPGTYVINYGGSSDDHALQTISIDLN